eukprot:scaffold319514_cov21-Tisochrysis_lutea.AAC.2
MALPCMPARISVLPCERSRSRLMRPTSSSASTSTSSSSSPASKPVLATPRLRDCRAVSRSAWSSQHGPLRRARPPTRPRPGPRWSSPCRCAQLRGSGAQWRPSRGATRQPARRARRKSDGAARRAKRPWTRRPKARGGERTGSRGRVARGGPASRLLGRSVECLAASGRRGHFERGEAAGRLGAGRESAKDGLLEQWRV